MRRIDELEVRLEMFDVATKGVWQEAKLLYVGDVLLAKRTRPDEDRIVLRILVDILIKHAAAALKLDSQVDFQVTRDVEAVNTEDLAQAIDYRVAQGAIMDGIHLLEGWVTDTWPLNELTLHIYVYKLLFERPELLFVELLVFLSTLAAHKSFMDGLGCLFVIYFVILPSQLFFDSVKFIHDFDDIKARNELIGVFAFLQHAEIPPGEVVHRRVLLVILACARFVATVPVSPGINDLSESHLDVVNAL